MRRSKIDPSEGRPRPKSPLGTRIPLSSLMQALAVAEHLSFRQAAVALGISQSSVSSRIKALETELGVLLFERRPGGVRLTDLGRRFVDELSGGIEQIEHAVRTARFLSAGSVGRLEIGTHVSIASGFLADLRRRYRIAYPDIEQSISEKRTTEVVSLIREGKLDAGFVVGSVDVTDCHSLPLWSETLRLALPEAHPLSVKEPISWLDFSQEIFLTRVGGAGAEILGHITRRFRELGEFPHIRKCDVGRDTLLHMVAAGEGVSLTSDAVAEIPVPGVVFRTLSDETERACFTAVWSPHNRSAALRNFINMAKHMSRSIGGPQKNVKNDK